MGSRAGRVPRASSARAPWSPRPDARPLVLPTGSALGARGWMSEAIAASSRTGSLRAQAGAC